MNLRTPRVYLGTDATGDFGLILDTIDGDRADGVAILCGCGSADVVAVAPGDASSDGCDFADTPLGRIGTGPQPARAEVPIVAWCSPCWAAAMRPAQCAEVAA